MASTTEQRTTNIRAQVKQGIRPAASAGAGTAETNEIAWAIADAEAATSERLYSIEPRSAASLYTGDAYNNRGVNEVGESPCSMRIVIPLGSANINRRRDMAGISDTSMSSMLSGTYNRFLMTSYDVSYSEKTQIMTTFGDNEVAYFFGKNPVVINISGMLIDSLRNDWLVDFVKMYDTFLRGTQLARNFETIELILPNMRVIGSILSLNYHQDASRDTDIPFSMQFYAKKISMISVPMSIAGPARVATTSIFGKTNNVTVDNLKYPEGQSTLNKATQGFAEPAWLQSLNGAADISSGYSMSAEYLLTNRVTPIVSVIANLSKIVQVTTNDLTTITNSFTAPLNAVLREVNSVAIQATSVATLIENGAAGIGHALAVPGINLRNTLTSLKNTAGVITRLPENVASAFKRNYKIGSIKQNAAILSSGKNGAIKKGASLSSGAPHSAQTSFII